jgi:hypothetical protein
MKCWAGMTVARQTAAYRCREAGTGGESLQEEQAGAEFPTPGSPVDDLSAVGVEHLPTQIG